MSNIAKYQRIFTAGMIIAGLTGCGSAPNKTSTSTATHDASATPVPVETKGISLFDGKTLGHWTPTKFGGEGEAAVKDGALEIAFGSPMSGVTWTGDVPMKMDYEISLEAERLDGHDFFCGLTFPYNDTSISLIVGGWGGGLVGLSSLDDHDASENETSTSMGFESNRWYKIRVRVTKGSIEAYIDGKKVVNCDIRDRKVGVRSEVELSRPLGIATYNTSAALRNIEMRKIVSKK